MELGLRGKRALLLAATKGLGQAAAQALAAEGAEGVVSSSSQLRCQEVAAKIAGQYGVRAHGLKADLFDPDSMDLLYESALRAMGGVDIVFINHPGPTLGSAIPNDAGQPDPADLAGACGHARATLGAHCLGQWWGHGLTTAQQGHGQHDASRLGRLQQSTGQRSRQ